MRKYKKTKKMDDEFFAASMSAVIAAVAAFIAFLLELGMGISITIFLMVFAFCFVLILSTKGAYSFLKCYNENNGKNKKQ